MKHARIAYDGAIHQATAVPGDDTRLQLADGRVLHENEVIWLPPVEPRTIFALGLNYADHAKESNMPEPAEPIIFMKATSAIIGPNDDVYLPPNAKKGDWEVELGVIIGKRGSNISEADAFKHIFGYTVVNDVSAREVQRHVHRRHRAHRRRRLVPVRRLQQHL